MVKNKFKIIFIFMASKNYTSNFLGMIIVHLQRHYSLHLPISLTFQYIFKIFQIFGDFCIILIQFYLEYSTNSK